jgi:glycosyltransferase involved in cell wall biosynthesis
MKITFVGDHRSPNLAVLISRLSTCGHECNLISLYRDKADHCISLKSLFFRRSPFSKATSCQPLSGNSYLSSLQHCIKALTNAAASLIYNLVFILRFLDLPCLAIQSRRIIARLSPDIVIAYRTQFEGYVCALAVPRKYLLFTQGSDFVYFALRSPIHFFFSRITVSKARAVLSDCLRDLAISRQISPGLRPGLIILGNGGIDISDELKDPPAKSTFELSILCIRPPAPYIDYSTLFTALSLVYAQPYIPPFTFSLIANEMFHGYLRSKADSCGLNPKLISFVPFGPKAEYYKLLDTSSIVVSPSRSDGLPISLIEAMLHGCFPIAQDLSSLREIIENSKNGFLYQQNDASGLCRCLSTALTNPQLLSVAHQLNRKMLKERFSVTIQMPALNKFIYENRVSLG